MRCQRKEVEGPIGGDEWRQGPVAQLSAARQAAQNSRPLRKPSPERSTSRAAPRNARMVAASASLRSFSSLIAGRARGGAGGGSGGVNQSGQSASG
jgi:hypothetical protein